MRKWSIGWAVALALAGCSDSSNDEVRFTGSLTTAADRVAHGRRIATVMGCTGCHGPQLRGDLMFDEAGFGKAYASNLMAVSYGEAALERTMRTGRRPDGSVLWGMPSSAFATLSRADMAAVLAFRSSLTRGGAVHPRPTFGPLADEEIAKGLWMSADREVARDAAIQSFDGGPTHALGRYLAAMVCSECHGADLTGNEMPFRPDLVIVASYDRAQFRRLMQHGEAIGGRDLGLMSGVARDRFAKMTGAEIDALYGYLRARSAARQ